MVKSDSARPKSDSSILFMSGSRGYHTVGPELAKSCVGLVNKLQSRFMLAASAAVFCASS